MSSRPGVPSFSARVVSEFSAEPARSSSQGAWDERQQEVWSHVRGWNVGLSNEVGLLG